MINKGPAIKKSQGLYTGPYLEWGFGSAETLAVSLEHVKQLLQAHGSIHGIGGMCDGSLVAALVAMDEPGLGV